MNQVGCCLCWLHEDKRQKKSGECNIGLVVNENKINCTIYKRNAEVRIGEQRNKKVQKFKYSSVMVNVT